LRAVIDPTREEAELREYLGADFSLERLQQYERTLADEFASCGDEQRFYRTSQGYLYNLTAFAMTETKLPYLEQLAELVPKGSRLLDYGCGIGSDGLGLIEAGYRVEFADFANPSTDYLRWRLERRGLDAPVHDLEREVPAGFDAAFAFDVIEHVADPFAFLSEMESRAAVVMVNLLEPEEDDQDIHHELPVAAILRRAARKGLLRYRVLHGRSHLVAYRTAGGASVAGYARLAAGRLRAAVAR
jgi:plasmid stabilization system protein ParE